MLRHLHPVWKSAALVAAAAAAACLAPATARAGGMAITMQDAAHLGSVFSSGAAAEDAATVYFNPAGLTYLTQPEVILSATYVGYVGGFTNDGSTVAGALPLGGGNGGRVGENVVVPTLHVAWPVSERLAFGFGVDAPFGLGTEYPEDWVGRYHALKSHVQTVNLSPSVAVRVGDSLSLGLGLDWQRIDAELSNALDLGLVGYSLGIPGFVPGGADALASIKGDDTSLGFNVGALWDAAPGTRLGLHWRSRITHDLAGSVDFSNVAAPFAATFPDQDVQARLPLPEIVSLSLLQQLTSSLALTADWSWWNWSRLQGITIDFADPATPDSTLRLDWKDASIYSAGLRWQTSERLTLRTGLAYNESPVPGAELRTPRVPDSDRIWAGVGASWRFNDQIRGDLGYARIFMKSSTTNNDDGAGHQIRGHYGLDVNLVSVAFSWRY